MDRLSQFSCPPWALRCENFAFVGVPLRRVALRRAQINRASKGASTLFYSAAEKTRSMKFFALAPKRGYIRVVCGNDLKFKPRHEVVTLSETHTSLLFQTLELW